MKTAGELGWPHICCFAHALHNSVSRSFQDIEVSNLIQKIQKCRSLVKHFRSSPKQFNILIEMQKKLHLSQVKLDTRWDSTYDMIERLITNKSPIVNLTLEKRS